MKNAVMLITFLLVYASTFSQSTLFWGKTYGGSEDDISHHMINSTDGGYVIAGESKSLDGDVTLNHGDFDIWVVKTDQFGDIQWKKCYGGSLHDAANDILETSDGGYIIAGYTYSSDGDITSTHGSGDMWVIKIDASGNIQWQKTYGGSKSDEAACIRQTTDGGYIIGGVTYSNNGQVTGNHGVNDCWVVKIDHMGELEWQKTYGGNDNDYIACIQQTPDGGYIFAGKTWSNSGDVTGNHGNMDIWVVKTDAAGAIQWNKCYGGSGIEYATYIRPTPDGGYIVSGTLGSNNGISPTFYGWTDGWIIKTDSSGNVEWQKNYGGSLEDVIKYIIITPDGGYLMAGYTSSINYDITNNHGLSDGWLAKIKADGTLVWSKCYGGTAEDYIDNIINIADGSCSLSGYSSSSNGDVSLNHGLLDYWLFNICANGYVTISISDETYCASTVLTASNGFADYIWNTSQHTQSIEVFHGGIYSVLATNQAGCNSTGEIHVPEPVEAYPYEKICMATLDETSSKIVIAVNKTLNVNTDSIIFFRSDNEGELFNRIGALSINEASVFVDEEANPGKQSYQYKIATMNVECIRQSELSPLCSSIYLQASIIENNNKVKLEWTPLRGVEFNNYSIYRRNEDGIWIKISDCSPDSLTFTDENASETDKFYQIWAKPVVRCHLYKGTEPYVLSNIVNPYAAGKSEAKTGGIVLFPNPVTDYLTICSDHSFKGTGFSITDITGRGVLSGKFEDGSFRFLVSDLPPGLYLLKTAKSGRVYKFIKKAD